MGVSFIFYPYDLVQAMVRKTMMKVDMCKADELKWAKLEYAFWPTLAKLCCIFQEYKFQLWVLN